MKNEEIAKKVLELLELKDERTSIAYIGKMADVTAPDAVEVQIGANGELWVNVNGLCILRCSRIKQLQLVDSREEVSCSS